MDSSINQTQSRPCQKMYRENILEMEGDRDSETYIYGTDTPYSPPPSPIIYQGFKHEGAESLKRSPAQLSPYKPEPSITKGPGHQKEIGAHSNISLRKGKDGKRRWVCSFCGCISQPQEKPISSPKVPAQPRAQTTMCANTTC